MQCEPDDLPGALEAVQTVGEMMVQAIMCAHGSLSLAPAPSFGRSEWDALIYRKPKPNTDEDLTDLINTGKKIRSYAGDLLPRLKGQQEINEILEAIDAWDTMVVPPDELAKEGE